MKPPAEICPRFESAVELLGKRWTGLLLDQLLTGPKRFGELAEGLEVSERVLSERLKELEAAGVVTREVSAAAPVRVSYRLAPKGQALSKVFAAIHAWAERWAEPARAQVRTPTRRQRRIR